MSNPTGVSSTSGTASPFRALVSILVFGVVRPSQSLVCVKCIFQFSVHLFSFGHCIICPSYIPLLWHLQTINHKPEQINFNSKYNTFTQA